MGDDEYARQLELQRKAFEAQFGSLESMGFEDKTKNQTVDEMSDSDESQKSEAETGSESEGERSFQGFFDDDEVEQSSYSQEKKKRQSRQVQHQPKVIKFDGTSDAYVAPSKKEQKLVRSGKAPKNSLTESRLQEELEEGSEGDDEAADVEKDNLQNDLELQRFLKESHLLSAFGQNTHSGADLTLETMNNVEYRDDQVFGKARSRTLEMRLKNLSSVNGKSHKLEKVPMNVRRGMVDKHIKRIKKHEHEAREGGIVLSKVKKGEFRKIDSTYRKDIERRIGTKNASSDAQRRAKRQKGIKVSSVGRSTRNGLIISPEEIRRINGDGKRNSKGRR
ncbi:LAME_0H18096g1_1 [Lachancea meyersii CBS 8951]|uniref:LAME_0H18096g1_1 n=1 Tax=Lachancea meyersii CBS 8951 TaxID=1266667 RepID=A0A1G4KIS0_9SACH|nr:LAME_0H18096g1_1 [Lachancea meyersii CBS 8951]